MNKQKTLIMTVKTFGIKSAGILVSVTALLMMSGLADAQSYQPYVDAQPSKTDVMTKADFDSRMGATTTGATSMPTGNNESGLPFTTYTDTPDFYIIPADKRPRIMNQGSCGSCVAWSTSTALASVLARQGKYPQFVPFLNMPDAIQFYIMGGRSCGSGMPNEGWNPPDALVRMTQTGTFLSVVEPISNQGVLGGSFASPMGDWWVKAGKSGSITNKDAMRKFIYTQGALVANFDVMYDLNRYTGGIYDHVDFVNKVVKPLKDNPLTAPIAPITEETLNMRSGGHAVAVVGYFKGGKIKLRDYMKPILPQMVFPDLEMTVPAFWIIQNSWGDKWGMNGLFYVAANQSYQALWVDPNTKARTLRQANTIDDTMWYMLDPSITSKGTDIRNLAAAPAPRTITFKNEAGYVAKMMISYFEAGPNGVPLPKFLFTDNIPLGQSKTLEVPKSAPNMNVTVNLLGVGTTKEGIFSTNLDAAFTGNKCFKAWGTIFDAKGGSCQ